MCKRYFWGHAKERERVATHVGTVWTEKRVEGRIALAKCAGEKVRWSRGRQTAWGEGNRGQKSLRKRGRRRGWV